MEKRNNKIIPFQRQRRDRRALTGFLAAALVVALVLAFFVVDGGRNIHSIRRFFTFGEQELSIPRSKTLTATQWDGALVTAGADGVTCYTREGQVAFMASADMTAPVLQAEGKLLLAWDAGGHELMLMNREGSLLLNPQDVTVLYDAELSTGGALAVLSQGEREKSVLRVYDRNQLLGYTLRSDTRHLIRCALSASGEQVAVVALGQEEGSFCSFGVLYHTEREEPVAEVPLGNQMILDVVFQSDGTLWFVGENSLVTTDSQGNLLGTCSYDRLVDYSLRGKGFCALMLEQAHGTTLVTLDKKCRILGETVLSQQGGALDVRGIYVAWMDGGTLTLSGSRLVPWSDRELSGNVTELTVGDTGVTFTIDGQGATRYLG